MKILKKLTQSLRGLGKDNAAIFDDIYRRNRWGGNGVYSGQGSEEENSKAYEEFVVDYVKTHGIKSIVDVGCGDFQVSSRILSNLDDVSYIGLDVSQIAVDHNNAKFAGPGIEFRQCDATRDPFPPGDLVLVREVLQHLSNSDILAVLPKLGQFPHALVSNTRKLSAPAVNGNQASGASSRVATCGGLWLGEPPFNVRLRQVLVVPHKHFATEIVTEELLA